MAVRHTSDSRHVSLLSISAALLYYHFGLLLTVSPGCPACCDTCTGLSRLCLEAARAVAVSTAAVKVIAGCCPTWPYMDMCNKRAYVSLPLTVLNRSLHSGAFHGVIVA